MNACIPMLGSSFVRKLFVSKLISDSQRVTMGLQGFKERFPDHVPTHTCSNMPIFVLSAGWGSGSTLVQRLIISSEKALIWGEPLDISAVVHRMSLTLVPYRKDWPPEDHFLSERSPEVLSREWIANLVPPIHDMHVAHQQFFSNWLGVNATDSGYARWGLKEVRLTIDHAKYLKWLFPDAKFIFVYRDLFKCYNSCRRRRDWYSIWPTHKATPIISFAHHWNHLTEGFLNGYKEVDGFLLKYEDLVADGYSLDKLKEYLELDYMDSTLLQKNVGARSKYRHPLIYPEKLILNSIGGNMRREIGYA